MERKKRVVPGEVCTICPERDNHHREIMLNVQKSAEVIVAERRRTESIGALKYNRERRKELWVQKTMTAARKEIARNVKGM